MPIPPTPPNKKSTSVAGSGAAAVKAAAAAASDAVLSGTYRTASDETDAKKAEIHAVRNALEAFELRLENGAISVVHTEPNSSTRSNRPCTSALVRQSQKLASTLLGTNPKSGADKRRTPTTSLTEEEVEARTRRQSDIADVRNLPSESDDDDDDD